MRSTRTILSAFVALSSIIAPALADINLAGCYDNYGDLDNFGVNTYQTQGACLETCTKANKAVFAVTKGSTCFCGDAIPEDGKVPEDQCNKQCQGYNQSCGGDTTFLFGYTGVVPPKPSSTSSGNGGSSTSKSKTTGAVQTTVVGQAPVTVTATSGADSGSGGTSKAGIAAGAVVGVIALIAIGVGVFLLLRRNRRRRAEEEYSRAVAAKEFTASVRKPASDSRLDPVMLQHRRLSDGSIADNEDYSRRILKVTNPDAP